MSERDWIAHLPAAVAEHVRALARLPDFPRHLARFSEVYYLSQSKDKSAGDEMAERARRLAPDDPMVRHCTEWSLRHRIRRWHYLIVNDTGRNAVYREALRRHVHDGMIVFEVGTGTGILAMMAVEAGAAHVYTCECEPLLAEVARENIARNGLSDRITVLAKRSNEVEVGRDLPSRADLFVAELVEDGLLGEQVLAITADVRARLLLPEAMILPDQIGLRGALVGGPEWSAGFRALPVSGFDVSALDRWGPSVVPVPRTPGPLLGDDVTVLHFDLMAATAWQTETKTVAASAKADQVVDGFLSWIWLRFGAGLEYSNRPPFVSCWTPQLHTFPRSLSVSPSLPLNLLVHHDGSSVRIWPA